MGMKILIKYIFFPLKKDSRTGAHKVTLVKDCVTASSVNMFKNKVNTYLKRAGYTQKKNVGLLISQWLPCPLPSGPLSW